MVSLHYPSVWRNKHNGVEWELVSKPNTGPSGENGCEAQSAGGGFGKVYWAEDADTLILSYISAQPRRSGLGALLTYCFADAAQMAGKRGVSITMANPHEHGFYLHMGFSYDQAALKSYVDSLSPEELVANFMAETLVEDGVEVTILPAHKFCPLTAETHHLFTRSHAATERAWALKPFAKAKSKPESKFKWPLFKPK